MQQSKGEPSLGELFAELTREMTTLVRQELRLATTEVGQKTSEIGKNVAFLAVGGAIAYAGLLAIIAAVVMVFANFVPWWLATFIVGISIAGIGYVLVHKGIDSLKEIDLKPRQTLRTIKEDVEWAKHQTN
jgi:Zn-dependent protease with chaperone function